MAVPVLTPAAEPVAVGDVVALLEGKLYGIETVTIGAAGAAGVETAAEVTAAPLTVGLEVADVLNAEDNGVWGRAEAGVSGGQSEPASAGRSHAMICR